MLNVNVLLPKVLDGILVSPQNSWIETLLPNISVMIFGNGAFGRQLGHKSGVLVMGLVPLSEETGEGSLSLSLMQLCEDHERAESCAHRALIF